MTPSLFNIRLKQYRRMSNSSKILKFAEFFYSEAGAVYLQLPSGLFIKIANKAMNAALRKVDNPLYVEQEDGFIAITSLKIENGRMNPVGFCALADPNMEMNPGFKKSDWARVHVIQAPNAWLALYLLGAGVYYAVSVMGKRGVIPDNSLTVPAQKVLSSIFASGQKDGTIVPDVLKAQGSNINLPYLRAGYLQPSFDTSKYAQAFEMGRKIKEAIPKEHQEMIIDSIENQWTSAYQEARKDGTVEQTVEPVEPEDEIKPIDDPKLVQPEVKPGFFNKLKPQPQIT